MQDAAQRRSATDPRVTGDYTRELRDGQIILVGVVHDHPASIHRVRTAVEANTETVALELPPVAVPRFRQFADSEQSPPPDGGEMSAAIQAANTDRIIGIDRPTVAYARALVGALYGERPSRKTVREVLSNTFSAVKSALGYRTAAAFTTLTASERGGVEPASGAAEWTDSPSVQAEDERRQIRRSRSFMNAFSDAPSERASAFEDRVREAHMADRLAARPSDERIVAVVGIDHLDPLTERLQDSSVSNY